MFAKGSLVVNIFLFWMSYHDQKLKNGKMWRRISIKSVQRREKMHPLARRLVGETTLSKWIRDMAALIPFFSLSVRTQ